MKNVDKVESIVKDSIYFKYYECYAWLIELGFDFEKNSAQDLVDCISYLYFAKYVKEMDIFTSV